MADARHCSFPVYCRACRTLEETNLLDKPITCPTCGGTDVIPYDAPELVGKRGRRKVFSWDMEELGRDLLLTDGRYLCPACQKMQLRFEKTGLWD